MKNTNNHGTVEVAANRYSRRDFLRYASLGVGAALAGGCPLPPGEGTGEGGGEGGGEGTADKRPNVLFILVDQLRADVCGVYGGTTISTPNIDKLASQGALFSNALSTDPLCTPYRGMFLTGRYPTHTGIIINFLDINSKYTSIAHAFRDAGYDTGCIGKWHISAGSHRWVGVLAPDREAIVAYRQANPETEFVPPGDGRVGFDHWESYNFHTAFNNYWYYEDEPTKIFSQDFETDTQIDQAIAFMNRSLKSDRPFFLNVSSHPPHPPFNVAHTPDGYLAQIPLDISHPPNVPLDHPRRTNPLAIRTYYAMSKNTDDNVGRIMNYLDESGLADNTIVVFTSDHGEQHGSHGRTNKMVPYAESVNVPLIIRWPNGVPSGFVSDVLYTPMDHFPTLCGLCGIDSPSELDGEDLSKEVEGIDTIQREAVLMMNVTSDWNYLMTQTRWPEWRAVRTRQYTYIKWLSGEEELYDNIADRYQLNDLAAGNFDDVTLRQMRDLLAALSADAHDDFLPGNAYEDWYGNERNVVRTALGPV